MIHVLGIDGGGSKTVCVLMNAKGEILGRGQSGPSNYQSIGIDTAKSNIISAIKQAVDQSFLALEGLVKIQGISLGLAGAGRAEDINLIRNLIKDIQTNPELPIEWKLTPKNIIINSDSVIALVGGLGHSVGIVVIAGTGSHIFGKNRQGITKRVGGWGYILGDEGSGYDIAIQGLKAALRSHDGRLESTNLIPQFQEVLKLNSIEELIPIIYRQGWGVKKIASLAPIVDQAAAEGDPVAQNIIKNAVNELVLATEVAIKALFEPTESFEIVVTGGVWQGLANFRHQFEVKVNAIAPLANIISPRHEPAYGAGLLALEKR
ncbi:MAG: ATPase [Oscillatoriales cyanobacterium CG2_30_40_61]|nr:MAG: ATPase [Oscillatoriales cyanobacterium CG2_30_40_61]